MIQLKCFSKDLIQPNLSNQDNNPRGEKDVTKHWLLQFVRMTASGFAEFREVSHFLW